MNPILLFGLQVVLTLIMAFLLVAWLRPYLYRILLDLCGNEVRTQFWLALSTLLLVGLPCAFALAYHPQGQSADEIFFEIAGRLGANLGGFLVMLAGVGLIVSLFALVAPRPTKE